MKEADPLSDEFIAGNNTAVANYPHIDNPTTFYPWSRLPTDLQLKIVDIPVLGRRTEGLTPQTHACYTNLSLLPFLQTNRLIRALAWRSHYTYGIILGYPTRSFKYPTLQASPFVRRIELHITVTTEMLQPFRKRPPYPRLSRENSSAPLRQEAPYYSSCWQSTFRHVEHFQVVKVINVQRVGNGGHSLRTLQYLAECLQGNKEIRDYSKPYQIVLRPATLSALVQGFVCGDHGVGRRPKERTLRASMSAPGRLLG